jgi:hypothetical protein
VYVNNAWAGDALGTAVTWTDETTHYLDYDAFGTVQAGVNAVATGGTVNVAAGTYIEQVSITRSLTLTGAGAATTIQAPAGFSTGDEVSIASGAALAISSFTIAGAGSATGIGDEGGTLSAAEIAVTGFSTGLVVANDGAATVTDTSLTDDVVGIVVGASISDTSSVTADDDD